MSRLGLAALVILAAVALLAAFGPLLWTIAPEATDPLHGLAGPSGAHPLGTDELGRDMLSRLIFGGRVSLMMGLLPVAIATTIGGTLGIVAGFVGGRINMIVMRIVDVFFAFPSVLLAVAMAHTPVTLRMSSDERCG